MGIRYQRLGFVELNVSDLDRSERFYIEQVGLEAMGRGPNDCRFLRCSDKSYDIVLSQNAAPGLKRIGFEMESLSALEALRSTLQHAGLWPLPMAATDAAAMHLRNAFSVTEPLTGATFVFFEAMHEVAGRPWVPTLAKIQRLGHIVLKTDRFPEAIAFFRDVMNFRISDQIDGAVTFMRCFPNPFHHSFALASGPRKAFHHVNFMTTEVDDIGRAIWRHKRAEVAVVAGPGRHPPSGSMFYYFLDPDGLTVEYSFGMEEFPEVDARKPRLLPFQHDSIDYWHGMRDPRMANVGEIEQAPGARS
jgi:2,3-dihydroxy-p-cumate/2,3-dihydroxybenzoate 3,4-dioxygenase